MIFGEARGPIYDPCKPSQEVLNTFKHSGNTIRKIKNNDKSIPVAMNYREAIKLAKNEVTLDPNLLKMYSYTKKAQY